jgi:hypothetical protein
MKKFLMLTLSAVFATISVFGQSNPNYASGSAENHVLKRAGFSKLKIGDQKISFAEADVFLADANIARRLTSGLRLEKFAIGFGVAGAVAFGGAFVAFASMLNATASVVYGILLIDTGLAFGLAAITLGTIGSVRISKTIKEYNNRAPITLGFAPTPGGLGLQLTF